ncbi:cilia- and flagella-associated protein 54 [Antennarius striatus]|uniref:cilia- and flagella-associated protein 54 n=1 Tax=Antennarius striatus TaxID=241820 RepID=UPI0035B3234A
MDLPASHYGKLDKRNPVISALERDVKSFSVVMKRVCSDNSSYSKGVKLMVELWIKYEHRLPLKMYQERMLQIADFLCGIKMYQLALWQGYSLNLLYFSSLDITEITDVDHLMASFFPEGLDTDLDIISLKARAMHGCALCIFELEKQKSILGQSGLCKLLRVLNFIRITMQAFQQHEHLYRQLYNGSLHIYTICRYLMTMSCSEQALEYLLWSSISLELSFPLMTAQHLPWIVTLYCAVCQCYYDNQAAAKAEEFAKRALDRINELAQTEELNDGPATRETQRAYKEASIKLAAMMFKRAVFETRRHPKPPIRIKVKITLKDIPSGPWPRTKTERMLMSLFDNSAAQFLGILEALSESSSRPLETRLPDELQEVIIELLSAGISILSGTTTTESLRALTQTSTLLDSALEGENKVPITSAIRFIKLLFQYKQPNTFAKFTREMFHVLSGLEGHSFRRAEKELALFDSFNSLLCSQQSHAKEDNMTDDQYKSSFSASDEFINLVETLHKSVCCSAPEEQPDGDLVCDVVSFLWGKLKACMPRDHLQHLNFKHYLKKVDNSGKWIWSLSMLCEVAFSCNLANVDCIMTAEMSHTLAILLESAAEHSQQTQSPAEGADTDDVKSSCFSVLQCSPSVLCQKACEVADKGREALSQVVAALPPPDSSAITDAAFMQKLNLLPPSTPSTTSPEQEIGEHKLSKMEKEEVETKATSYKKTPSYNQSTPVSQLAIDLHFELDIIYHRASLRLLWFNAVTESELLGRIKKNKVSKALFLTQKALLVFNNTEANNSNNHVKSLLEEAISLIEKAAVEERKLFISSTLKTPAERKDRRIREDEDNPPPAPILISCTDHSFTLAPAPYNLEGKVRWYQLCGREAEGINQTVRLGDCSLPGTGNLVPVVSGECLLRVDGLKPNRKYVFAVAAYNSQGKLLGNAIGGTTFPLLASMPIQLLSAWAHLAQVAFQTIQYTIAKTACRELWSHYTCSDPTSSTQDRLATTRLSVQTLQHSSPHLCQLFLTSIFIETEINIQQGSLYWDSFSHKGPFIWDQEARLAECERMLVAMDLAMWMNEGSAAVQVAVNIYGLLVPLIFHQIASDPVIQVLKKCLIVFEENSNLLIQKWTGSTSESLMHVIACITYYLCKSLRALREYHMASVMMDCGRNLLQEVYDGQLQSKKDHTTANSGYQISCQLKTLQLKNNNILRYDAACTADKELSQPLADADDSTIFYDLISNKTLKDTYEDVMKLRQEAYFTELAALLLQRTMEEGHPDLVLKWGQSIFECLCKLGESNAKGLDGERQSKRRGVQTPSQPEPPQRNEKHPSHIDTRKKPRKNISHNRFQKPKTKSQKQAVKTLIKKMSAVRQRYKKRIQLRNMCCEERVWRSQLNYTMAHAHLALLYQNIDQTHGGTLQHRYSQFDPLCFSLASSGIMIQRDSQPQPPSKYEVAERTSSPSHLKDYLDADNDGSKKGSLGNGKYITDSVSSSVTEESYEEEEERSQTEQEHVDMQGDTSDVMLESLHTAALHLRRAMVLAHRGSHWTLLQAVCQTVWDQSCRLDCLLQQAAQLNPPCPITPEQLLNTTTSLLVVATDLLMDMLNRLGFWSLYDIDLTEEALESSLHFSGPLDGIHIDLRWVRTMVLHTLECLHDSGKWETLAHFALLFNSYTRERYAWIITPLLVHAQKKLIGRINSFGGPAVPQPHQVKTQKTAGIEFSCRSYAGSQLLSAWTPHSLQQLPICKNSTHRNPTLQDTADLKAAEIQLSMSLVCVPLDVEDTLSCYRQALEKRPRCLQVLQQSRSLLLLLLAFKQPCFPNEMQSRISSRSASLVDFSPTDEDYSTLSTIYSIPISADHMPTVTAAYCNSIKYLQASGHDSLRVLALHEMGNLQFYNQNPRAANSSWSKAVDLALQTTGTVDKWDGVSFGGGTLQQTVQRAGIWGCLNAAALTAKIAHFILTSDTSQRTNCCLLSAHLFKCVLCCSLAHPQDDLRYVCHDIGEELLPGVDLLSDPHRLHLGTTVTSLHFTSQWLFTTGYYIKLFPILALYLHFVGTVCRDLQRAVEGKIIKIRALTELCLFTEAVKELSLLLHGTGVPLPYGHSISKDNAQSLKTFQSDKSLLDNVEVLENLLNCDFAPGVQLLYGPTLCYRINLARIQLVLALSDTIQGHPVSDSEGESSARIANSSENFEEDKQDNGASCLNTEKPKVLSFATEDNLSLERLKVLLLKAAHSLLHSTSQQFTSQSCGQIENVELTIESNLLKAKLYLQQGHVAHSLKEAVSSLLLLQTSPVIEKQSKSDSQKPMSEPAHAWNTDEQGTEGCSMSEPLQGDCSTEVEASERLGVVLWLRCRLALVHSLVAHVPNKSSLFTGMNINKEAARLIKEGLDECSLWGDLDVRALLMFEGAELAAQRGKSDASMAMLQESISLLSGRKCMSPGSTLTLARATLLLSNLRGEQSITLLKLTQKVLQNMVGVFGQRLVLDDGNLNFSPPGISNIYLPSLSLLERVTLQIGHIQDLSAERPVSIKSSQPPSKQCSQLSTPTEIEVDAVVPSLSDLNATSPDLST